jgi:hypothetical protein
MDAEANRSAENLLILCLFHHELVDNKEQEAQFPVETLRQWKDAQLAEYDRAVKAGEEAGWHLTDEEAAEVIDKSERSTSVTVQGETVIVGGMGGLLGGGGGGGGVIGTGSLAGGRGGDAAKIIVEGQAGKLPGAGGGGGGRVVYDGPPTPHAGGGTEGSGHIAGVDGGSGGDTEIKIGEGSAAGAWW